MPDTETLDRLYLEWSQFTKARTRRELELVDALANVLGLIDDYGRRKMLDEEKADLAKAHRALKEALR